MDETLNEIQSKTCIPVIETEISPKYLVRRKESMLAFRRGLRLVSTRTAFGDASESDAESGSRRLYVTQPPIA